MFQHERKQSAQARERAVKAITEQNQLQKLMAAAHRNLAATEKKLVAALERGDEPEAARLQQVKQEQLTAIQNIEVSLTKVRETTEEIKAQMRQNENNIRLKLSVALQEKEAWRRYALQNSPTSPDALLAFRVLCLLVIMAAVFRFALWLR